MPGAKCCRMMDIALMRKELLLPLTDTCCTATRHTRCSPIAIATRIHTNMLALAIDPAAMATSQRGRAVGLLAASVEGFALVNLIWVELIVGTVVAV